MKSERMAVDVRGIPELARALKDLDKDLYRDFRKGMKAIAVHVIGKAQGKGAPAGILKPRATMKGAGIAFPRGGPGSGSEPGAFYPWLDFGGGKVHARGVTSNDGTAASFRREVVEGGRFLYPAIGESKEFIATTAYSLIDNAARANGFEVRKA